MVAIAANAVGGDGPVMTLEGARILLVEDDPYIAMDLRESLEAAGAVVLGPAYNLAVALRLAETANLHAAVLDLRLERGTTLPVAERLSERGIPFLFQTSDPNAARRARPDVLVLAKPITGEELVRALEGLV